MKPPFVLSESDQPRTRKADPLELYLWPNDPERTTITTDTGLPEYQVFTTEGQLFGAGPISSFHKLVDGADGGIAVWVSLLGSPPFFPVFFYSLIVILWPKYPGEIGSFSHFTSFSLPYFGALSSRTVYESKISCTKEDLTPHRKTCRYAHTTESDSDLHIQQHPLLPRGQNPNGISLESH